jgi:CDP-Glycerol:Poly(glycerophosphate) glycerophosphotransferase
LKTLVVVASAAAARARARDPAEPAPVLVAWTSESASALRSAGRPGRAVSEYVSPEDQDRIDEAAIAWTKGWGTRSVWDGRSIRDLLVWKGVSLWWFAELYLHHSTACPRYVRLIETFFRILEAERPDEVESDGLGEEEAVLLGRACTVLGILFHGPARPRGRRLGLRARRVSLRARLDVAKCAVTAGKAALAGPPPAPPADPRPLALFLSHAAFWRERRHPDRGEPVEYEHYFDRLLPEVAASGDLRVFVLAVGPRAAFRRRGVADRVAEWARLHPETGPYVHVNRYTSPRVLGEMRRAAARARRAWRALRRSAGLAEAFTHRGVGFADLAAPDLAGTLLRQLPWAVRSYEEMTDALAAIRPAVVCLYAESSGWGRAAIAACRAAGVPTVAIQHGILYPRYYSYRHGADEADCPRPDRTALFGESARKILLELGHYPPESLVLTGSPKFDDLVAAAARWDRARIRRRLEVGEDERLVIVASRHRRIRDTHASIGADFPALVRAVDALPGVKALIKPHPAEPESAYAADLRAAGAVRVRVLPPGADLMELLHAADGLVTVESLSAVEALVLRRPVLVLSMPTHLRDLVEAGAALGVRAGEDPTRALRDMLFDEAVRSRLEQARERYLRHVAQGVDGGATARIVALLRETARPRGVVGLGS